MPSFVLVYFNYTSFMAMHLEHFHNTTVFDWTIKDVEKYQHCKARTFTKLCTTSLENKQSQKTGMVLNALRNTETASMSSSTLEK